MCAFRRDRRAGRGIAPAVGEGEGEFQIKAGALFAHREGDGVDRCRFWGHAHGDGRIFFAELALYIGLDGCGSAVGRILLAGAGEGDDLGGVDGALRGGELIVKHQKRDGLAVIRSFGHATAGKVTDGRYVLAADLQCAGLCVDVNVVCRTYTVTIQCSTCKLRLCAVKENTDILCQGIEIDRISLQIDIAFKHNLPYIAIAPIKQAHLSRLHTVTDNDLCHLIILPRHAIGIQILIRNAGCSIIRHSTTATELNNRICTDGVELVFDAGRLADRIARFIPTTGRDVKFLCVSFRVFRVDRDHDGQTVYVGGCQQAVINKVRGLSHTTAGLLELAEISRHRDLHSLVLLVAAGMPANRAGGNGGCTLKGDFGIDLLRVEIDRILLQRHAILQDDLFCRRNVER